MTYNVFGGTLSLPQSINHVDALSHTHDTILIRQGPLPLPLSM